MKGLRYYSPPFCVRPQDRAILEILTVRKWPPSVFLLKAISATTRGCTHRTVAIFSRSIGYSYHVYGFEPGDRDHIYLPTI